MTDFSYIARDLSGQKVTGVVSAASQREAVGVLSGKELFPLEVAAQQVRARRGSARVRPQLVAKTYTQLAGLLRSGVPLLKSLDVLREQYSNPALVGVLSDIHDQVEEGSSLADAMHRHPRVFGEMATSIIRAGGEGGFMEDALLHVADFTEKQQELKSRTIGALFYPMLLAVAGAVIINVLIIFFVPRFESLFASLREIGELPMLTDWVLWFSGLMQTWWPALVVAIVVGFLLVRSRLQTPAGRRTMDGFKLRMPVLGDILLSLAVARFCRVLGTLLTNGVPILRSLEISSAATGNRVLADAINDAAENISAGQSLTAPLAACGHFPTDVVEMIAVAEESNTLEQVLRETADALDRQTWRRLDLMVRLIEPIMLMLMAGIVLIVVLALVLPMLKMSMTI
jgi:general secretion pathway protein F/type IV pilus assembly protein PilC